MKNIHKAMVVFALMAASTSSSQAANSHIESALAAQADLSMFYQALRNTGVANELREDQDYTVFAPTNAAFVKIHPNTYPCFYTAQCRIEVAAIMRNHIVLRNGLISDMSRQSNGAKTISGHYLDIEQPYKGDFLVNGHHVLYPGNDFGLYRLDGVIASDNELAQFRTPPASGVQGNIIDTTVSTYCVPVVYPGGYPSNLVIYAVLDKTSDYPAQTTIVTKTIKTQ